MVLPSGSPTRHLETLSEIGRVVSSTLDLGTLYDTIYQQIGRVMDASQFFIALHRLGSPDIEVPYLQEEGVLWLDNVFPFGDNTTSVIIEQGISLRYGNQHEYRHFEQSNGLKAYVVGEHDSESGIFVALNTGSRTIGALSVQSLRPGVYTAEDERTLAVIASQAAIAIENARLYEESQDSVRQMEALLHVAQLLNGTLDLEEVLDAILLSMRDVMPYAYAAILLPDPSTGDLMIVGSIGQEGSVQRSRDTLASIRVPCGRGVSGAVFRSATPLIVPDVRAFPGFVDHELDGVYSEMAAPLRRGDDVVGVLDVGRHGTDAFRAPELDLLALFASQAAIAIENARLFSQQRRRVDELHTIQHIVERLTPLHDAEAIAALIAQELEQLIDYHHCVVFRLSEADDKLMPIQMAGLGVPEVELRLGQGLSGWVARQGVPQLVGNSLLDTRFAPLFGTEVRAESMICAPLVYQGKAQGVITLTELGVDQFDENDLRLLEIIASQLAIAFDRARLYEELRTEAITDPLTKLMNRRYLLERYREERSRAIRNGHSLTALMLDIDRFKLVNDSYGHAAGDVVLQELAAVVRAETRAEDIVARYGGEEFCVLLPESPVDEAELVAERLRAVVERHTLPMAAGEESVTVSIGVGVWQPGDEGEEVFTRADRAMYQVKAFGGNGVYMGESGDRQRPGLREPAAG